MKIFKILGHSKIEGNQRADELATLGIKINNMEEADYTNTYIQLLKDRRILEASNQNKTHKTPNMSTWD